MSECGRCWCLEGRFAIQWVEHKGLSPRTYNRGSTIEDQSSHRAPETETSGLEGPTSTRSLYGMPIYAGSRLRLRLDEWSIEPWIAWALAAVPCIKQ